MLSIIKCPNKILPGRSVLTVRHRNFILKPRYFCVNSGIRKFESFRTHTIKDYPQFQRIGMAKQGDNFEMKSTFPIFGEYANLSSKATLNVSVPSNKFQLVVQEFEEALYGLTERKYTVAGTFPPSFFGSATIENFVYFYEIEDSFMGEITEMLYTVKPVEGQSSIERNITHVEREEGGAPPSKIEAIISVPKDFLYLNVEKNEDEGGVVVKWRRFHRPGYGKEELEPNGLEQAIYFKETKNM